MPRRNQVAARDVAAAWLDSSILQSILNGFCPHFQNGGLILDRPVRSCIQHQSEALKQRSPRCPTMCECWSIRPQLPPGRTVAGHWALPFHPDL